MQTQDSSLSLTAEGQQRQPGDDSMDGASSSAGQAGDYDDEPVLKYQRMGADVGKLLSVQQEGVDDKKKETVVMMAVHDSYLVSESTVRVEFRVPALGS